MKPKFETYVCPECGQGYMSNEDEPRCTRDLAGLEKVRESAGEGMAHPEVLG